MPDAYVLMTAMPPTTGHLDLIRFAHKFVSYGGGTVNVLVNTQPGEPFPFERVNALRQATRFGGLSAVDVRHMHETLEQDPSTPGFREMWRDIMFDQGFQPGDLIVSSESYGKWLAEMCGGRFIPYDIERVINPAKASKIREMPYFGVCFNAILPEFQSYLRLVVTVFGAESTGKTTLAKDLAKVEGGFRPEYARPFLENTSIDINVQSMTDIWYGQAAQQRMARDFGRSSIIIQDTDLFSTVGYWNLNQHGLGHLPTWSGLGAAPQDLVNEAIDLKSDLYIVTRSNIPFEEDPIRYGGSEREGPDDYWIGLCEEFDLPYVVLDQAGRGGRTMEALHHISAAASKKAKLLQYDRGGF